MRRQLTVGALAALLGFSTIGCDEQDYNDPAAPVIDDTEIEPGDSYEVEDDPTNTIYPDQPLDDEPTAEPTPSGDNMPETAPQPTPPTGNDTGTTGTEPDNAVSEVPASELPDDDGN